MALNISTTEPIKTNPKRYVSLDFARGIAILLMIFVHVIHAILDIDYLMSDEVIVNQPIIALSVLIFIPFIGGLAGFFLLISSSSNMISMYRDLELGKKIKSLVVKQVIGGLLLLIFAMICEGLLGYWGLLGDFFLNLNDPINTNWSLALWRWNHFETIHAIAWCLIINGCIQGLLSLRENWKNRKNMIISYAILAIVVVGLTYPIWMLFYKILPGYPFSTFPSGNEIIYPSIGTESFWQILRAPFVAIFASQAEPLFPYLAISFIGSIIGIVLSKPKDEINRNFPKKMFLIGTVMFVVGLIWVLIVIFLMLSRNDFETAAEFYMTIIYHRYWSPENPLFNGIPQFAWLGQFLAVNGLSVMMLIFLFRLIEFRGISDSFAKRSKLVRRFGIIAFTNYNNQWLFFLMWEVTSLMIYQDHYRPQLWLGTTLVIILTLVLYSLILWCWEKISYIGSLEWFIRTITNNIVPLRRKRFGESSKWWQRGKIDPERVFYNACWVNIANSSTFRNSETKEELGGNLKNVWNNTSDSRLALTTSLVSLFSVLFAHVSFISLALAIYARKYEGRNKQNTAALIISFSTIVILIAVIIVLFILPIGLLGLF